MSTQSAPEEQAEARGGQAAENVPREAPNRPTDHLVLSSVDSSGYVLHHHIPGEGRRQAGSGESFDTRPTDPADEVEAQALLAAIDEALAGLDEMAADQHRRLAALLGPPRLAEMSGAKSGH